MAGTVGATKYYPTTTTSAISATTANDEVEMSTTAPGSGTWSGTVNARGTDPVLAGIYDTSLGVPVWAPSNHSVSVDATTFPSGLQLWSTSNTRRVTSASANRQTSGSTTWDTDTGTGVHTGTVSWNVSTPYDPTDKFVVEFVVDNGENMTDLSYTFAAGADTWAEWSGGYWNPPFMICGAECQINSDGSASGWLSHWHSVDSGISASTTAPRNGSYSWEFDSTASSTCRFINRTETAQAKVYARFFFRLPTTSQSHWMWQANAGTGRFVVEKTGTTVRAFIRGDDQATYTYSTTNNLTVSADTWYGVELETDASGTTWGMKWRTWTESGGWTSSENLTQGSNAASASTLHLWGITNLASYTGVSLYMDDMAFGYGDYVYDDSSTNGVDAAVLRYNPVSDGTHNFNSNSDFLENGSTALGTTATDAYTYIDAADMMQTTTYLEQDTAGTGEYVEFDFASETGDYDDIRAIQFVATCDAATSSRDGILSISDDSFTNSSDPITIEDFSTGLNHHATVVATSPDTFTPWTKTQFNALQGRIGYSSVGNQNWYSVAAEVEWTTLPAGTEDFSGTTSTSATSGATVSGERAHDATISDSATSGVTASGESGRSDAATASHTSSTTAAGNALESKSGTASTSATSGATVAGQRAQDATTSTSAASSVAITGATGFTGTATTSAASDATTTGQKAYSATTSTSAASAVNITGSRAQSASVTAAHSSSATIAGERAQSATITVASASSAAITASTGRLGTAAPSSASAAITAGTPERQGTATASSTSSTTATGAQGAQDFSGTASASHTSAINITAESARSDAITESVTSAINIAGSRGHTATISESYTSAIVLTDATGRLGVATPSSASDVVIAGQKDVGAVASEAHASSATTAGQPAKQGTSTAASVSSATPVGSKGLTGTLSASSASSIVVVGEKTFEAQYLRPISDLQSTGWTTAPLWSKVDESSPDGTVISATSS